MQRYGIMGGTFDPIHYGHLLVAEVAREELGLQRIIFIPCGTPAHKKDYLVTSAEMRWRMTLLAIQNNPGFEGSRLEIDRQGPSYAVDTLGELLEMYPGESPYFITGMDAILEILTWHRSGDLPDLARFVAAARPGYDVASARLKLPERFLQRIDFLRVPLLDISSTGIRQRVREGRSIRYMTPEPVREFILQEGLYTRADGC